MSRHELIKLILKIQHNEGTEEEVGANIDLLANSVLDPDAVDYIFQHNWTAEFIADENYFVHPYRIIKCNTYRVSTRPDNYKMGRFI